MRISSVCRHDAHRTLWQVMTMNFLFGFRNISLCVAIGWLRKNFSIHSGREKLVTALSYWNRKGPPPALLRRGSRDDGDAAPRAATAKRLPYSATFRTVRILPLYSKAGSVQTVRSTVSIAARPATARPRAIPF